MRNFLNTRRRSFGFAFKGIGLLFQTQIHAKIHLAAIVTITLLGLYFGLEMLEWALIILCMTLVVVCEGINTALEFVTDLASPEYHTLAGKAKDVAAGSVLMSVIGCAVVWVLIFVPRIWLLLTASKF